MRLIYNDCTLLDFCIMVSFMKNVRNHPPLITKTKIVKGKCLWFNTDVIKGRAEEMKWKRSKMRENSK